MAEKSTFLSIFSWIACLLVHRALSFYLLRSFFRGQESGLGTTLLILVYSYIYWILGTAMSFEGIQWSWLALSVLSALVVLEIFRKVVDQERAQNISDLGANRIEMDWGSDIIFWIVFLTAILIRGFLPNLDYGEKYADMMIFQSLLEGSSFPPQDLWLSGYQLNYYYFSQLFFLGLTKMSGVPPEIAFHLSTCTVTGLMASTVYSFLRYQKADQKIAVLGSLFIFACGNWHWLIEYLGIIQEESYLYWWNASRAIPDTITEFPYFSFLLGDFHAHFNSIPWLILTLFLILKASKRLKEKIVSFSKQDVLVFFFLTLSLGVHYPANPWNLPIFSLLILIQFYKRLKVFGLMGVTSVGLYLPFWISYLKPSGTGGLSWVKLEYVSPFIHFLSHWGLFFFIMFLIIGMTFQKKYLERNGLVCLLVGLILGYFWGGMSSILIVFMALGWISSKYFSWQNWEDQLILLSLIVILLIERLSLDMTYPTYPRLNTVFKFYTVIWCLFSITVPLKLNQLLRDITSRGRALVGVYLSIVILISLGYPTISTASLLRFKRFQDHTLDGMSDWDRRFPGEREMIDWFRKNTDPKDIVLEAFGNGYTDYARVSTFAGRPTYVGWLNHEQVWRSNGYQLVFQRRKKVEEIGAKYNLIVFNQFLREHRIRWIVLGRLEREQFSKELVYLIDKYPIAFSNPHVQVHQVRLD